MRKQAWSDILYVHIWYVKKKLERECSFGKE